MVSTLCLSDSHHQERKKNLPLVHNHIYVQPHHFINFDLFLIKLDLCNVNIALSCHQQKTTVFTTVFTFFSTTEICFSSIYYSHT